jgi:hypothetical protein
MIASPMNFSTTPPWRSSSAFIESKYRVITSRSDSESSFSPIAVDPLRSENTIETTFRTSWTGAALTSGDPHAKQNFATSGLSVPHWEQNGTRRVCTNRESGRYSPVRTASVTGRWGACKGVANPPG